ncbi:lactate racemase domain-containing protein [Desulfitobacterium sp. Sab5]|uniref:lactate racemase domain-containing protein n=1 Tax=Desulfitobacterium nosdiversum TaxID=3375356 RepID=UPI003CE7FE89
MGIYAEILKDVSLPKMSQVKQSFPDDRIQDIPMAIHKALQRPGTLDQIQPGQKVALTVGSRGVNNLPALVQAMVWEIKSRGAEVFIIPAMGSHGGATPEGQKDMLLGLGIRPEIMGAEIVSSMEVTQVGTLPDGLPVYVSTDALKADAIVLLNRIKPHTAFRGKVESGLVKMLTIGLGKQKGAEACHAHSFKHMARHIVEMGSMLLEKAPVVFGLGAVENAYDHTHSIFAIPAERLLEEEPEWLNLAKQLMPSIPVSSIDVLIIDEIGKDISGDGMDPNITGRYPTPYASGGPEVSKMVLLDLTERSHGNANGIGTADIVSKRLVEKMSLEQTYPNALTSTVTGPVKIPLTLDNDYDVIRAAIKTCNAIDLYKTRIVRLKNTLSLSEIWVSEAIAKEMAVQSIPVEIGELQDWKFDEQKNFSLEH